MPEPALASARRPRPDAAPDVVFIGHDATRTGAPLMYLYFLRWVRAHTPLAFEIVLVDGGPLVDDFAAVGPVTVLSELRRGRSARAGDRAVRRALAPLRAAPTVYANSIASVRAFPYLELPDGDRHVILHVHELEGALGTIDDEMLDQVLNVPDHFVAASDLVKRNLVERHGVPADRIDRHYEFIDVAALDEGRAAAGPDLRGRLGIPADARIVGAVGVCQWRKGPDLFVMLARILEPRAGEHVHFVWLGADPASAETRALRADIERASLADRVHVVPAVADPGPWFRLFDVFALTSREDPFPLVCLEASLLGVPIVCFDNTGMAEFAGDGDCGFVVEYLDVEAMAARVRALLDDEELRTQVGARASASVRERYDYSVGAPALHAALEGWRRP